MLELGKGIENRVEESSTHRALMTYRKAFLLHASAGVGSIGDFAEACDFVSDVADELAWVDFRDKYLGIRMHHGIAVFYPLHALPRHGIIGRARCVGLIEPNGQPYGAEGREAVERLKQNMRWHIRGQWGHILDDVRPLPFVECN